MTARFSRYQWAALAFLAALFAFQFYRAATQSFTVDEAATWSEFVRPSPPVLFNHYDAKHHMLYTYLEWIANRYLGSSELVLRLPCVLACAGFFAVVFRLMTLIAGRGALFLLGVVFLTLNPMVLDLLVAARGYGLGLALFAWAIDSTLRRNYTASGVLLSLSVGASLIFAFPAVGLTVALWAKLAVSRQWSFWPTINAYAGPAIVTALLLTMLPLLHMRPDPFYYGAANVAESVNSMVIELFYHKDTFFTPWVQASSPYWGWAGLVAAAAAFVVALIRSNWPATLISGSALATLSLVGLAHFEAGVRYPMARTGVYLVFLISLAALSLIALLPRRASAPAAVAVAATTLLFATQLDPRAFCEWRFDARTKFLLRQIRLNPERPVRIAGYVYYRPSVNYYRHRLHLENAIAGYVPANAPGGADYYLLVDGDAKLVNQWNLRVLHHDNVCGCMLAVPR